MKTWRAEDDLTLRRCADQGIIALCYALMRPPGEVRARAVELRVPIVEPAYTTASMPDRVPSDYFDLIELYGSAQAEYCPRCGKGIIVPWHPAGKLGICPVCYRQVQQEALWETLRAEEEKREHNRLKKRVQIAREGNGTNPRKASGVRGPSPYGPGARSRDFGCHARCDGGASDDGVSPATTGDEGKQ